MGVLMAALLCAAGMVQETPDYLRRYEDEAPPVVKGVAIARLGAWTGRDFEFQATRTDGLVSTSKQKTLFSASAMAGLEFYDRFLLLGSVEAGVASHLSAEVAGLYIGWHQRPKERYGRGVPDEATVYAGVVGGNIDVDEPNFGDFDTGIGFGGGLSFGWTVSPNFSVDLYGEYRFLEFDYKKDVVSGNDRIGGNTGWFGAGVSFRF